MSDADGIAIDCEMVQVARGKLALAHVVAVDWEERVLLDEHVDPGVPVLDYLTRYSGLRPGDLDGAPSLAAVQSRVAALIEGRVLVGHAVANDLKALRLKHPKELTRDTAALDWGARDKKLSKLASEVLGLDIQGATHSPEEDAVASLRLLKYHQRHGAPPLRTVDVALTYATPAPRPVDAPCAVVPAPADDASAATATAAAAAACGDGEPLAQRWTLRLPWSRDARDALLRWFKAARQQGGATALVFPASLTKQERGAVHKEAQARKLPTESAGVDDERFISVLADASAASAASSGALPPRTQHVVTLVYRWAQEAAMHAACDAASQPRDASVPASPPPPSQFRPLSLGELGDLLGSGRELPPPYAELRRRAGAMLDAAGPTVPALADGVDAAERTRRDWQRWSRFG